MPSIHAVTSLWSIVAARRRSAPSLVLLTIAALVGAESACAETLRLTSGDLLPGKLLATTKPGTILWQSEFATRPFEFPTTTVAAIDFANVQQPNDPSGPFCFELHHGDLLYGRLIEIREDAVVIESPYVGRATLARDEVHRITRTVDDNQLVYLGPNGLREWSVQTPGLKWKEQGSQIYAVDSRASIFANLGLPTQAAIEVEISWTEKPGFTLALGVDDDGSWQHMPFRLGVWDESLVLARDLANRGDRTSLKEVAAGPGRIHIHLLLDQEQGSLAAYDNAGRHLGTLELPDDHNRPRQSVQLIHRSGNVRLERLRITRSGGVMAKHVDPADPHIRLDDGSVELGRIASFGAAGDAFAIEDSDGRREVPAARVASVVLTAPNGPTTRPVDDMATVIFRDGSRLSGRLAGVAEQAIQIIHPGLQEPAAAPIADVSLLATAQPSMEIPGKQSGRLWHFGIGAANFHGTLVDAASTVDGSCLVCQPQGSRQASPIRQGTSGIIAYRDRTRNQNDQQRRVAARQQAQRAKRPAGSLVGELPAQDASTGRLGIHLRTGDVVPCRISRVDEQGVWIESSTTEAKLIPHRQIKAAVLRLGGLPPELADKKRFRLLTLPRIQQDNPPTHVLRTRTGDYLRCRLLDMNAKQVTVETRLETKRFDRQRLSHIIWLHDVQGAGDSGDSPGEGSSAAWQVQAVASNAVRLTFAPERLAEGVLYGTSEALGACQAPLHQLDQLLLGDAIHVAAAQLAYHGWRLTRAPQPRFITGEGDAAHGAGGALVDQVAPAFELDLLTGERFRLADRHGSVVVLDFWASWCGPCVQSMPAVAATVEEFAEHDVQLVAVNLQESAEKIRAALDRLDLDVAVALDEEGVVAGRYGVAGLPQTVVINDQGEVARVFLGGGPSLAAKLRAALGEVTGAAGGE